MSHHHGRTSWYSNSLWCVQSSWSRCSWALRWDNNTRIQKSWFCKPTVLTNQLLSRYSGRKFRSNCFYNNIKQDYLLMLALVIIILKEYWKLEEVNLFTAWNKANDLKLVSRIIVGLENRGLNRHRQHRDTTVEGYYVTNIKFVRFHDY